MTLQELQSKHPDIYQEVFSLGAASLDMKKLQDEAKAEGVNSERERVTKIMAAQAEQAMTLKAIEDGSTVEAAGWMFFEAEKKNRTQKLEDLKTAKPESAGASAKESGEAGKDFIALRDAYRKEQKCGLGTATSAIAKQYPEIHQAWLKSQTS